VAVPSHQRVGLHDGEDRTPLDEPREHDERQTRRGVGATRGSRRPGAPGSAAPAQRSVGCRLRYRGRCVVSLRGDDSRIK
jgi:hypothetical protein